MKKRFIFDENYIKKYAKKDKIKWLVIGVSSLVLIIIIIIVILATRNNKEPSNSVIPEYKVKTEIVLEAGNKLPDISDYFEKLENIDINDIKIIYPEEFEISYDTSLCSAEEIEKLNNVKDYDPKEFDCVKQDLRTPAVYGVTIIVLDEENTVNLKVVDSTSPVIMTSNIKKYVEEGYILDEFVKLCFDISSECTVSYYDKDIDDEGNVIDYSKITEPGEHIIKLVGVDAYGNVSEPVETKLTLIETEETLYTVTFNSNGGSSITSVMVPEGSVIVEPDAPIRDGYNFLGWYVGTNKFAFASQITKDITLVAKWQKIEDNQENQGNEGNTGESTGGGNSGTVTPSVINVSSVSLDYKKVYVYVGDSKTVKATVKPTNATNKSVSWKSSDTSIAQVDNGKITAIKAGTVTVTATAGGKSASVEVVVKEKSSGTSCKYGDVNYNTSKYTLSVDLTNNNCAVNPNLNYNETVSVTDYSKMQQELTDMGFKLTSDYFEYKANYVNVKNNSGLGLVGYQITVTINVIDTENPYLYMTAQYIIKNDGSRQFIKNNIEKNNVKFG